MYQAGGSQQLVLSFNIAPMWRQLLQPLCHDLQQTWGRPAVLGRSEAVAASALEALKDSQVAVRTDSPAGWWLDDPDAQLGWWLFDDCWLKIIYSRL